MRIPLSARAGSPAPSTAPNAAHLSYCTNIHPGESWEQVNANLRQYVPQLKARLAPEGSFGIGLRLSAQAASALAAPAEMNRFKQWLSEQDCYVFTLNGFPYGPFHGTRVKQDVYLPDWASPERLKYSDELAQVLTDLLADQPDISGSISTVPGCYRPLATPAHRELIAENLVLHGFSLWRLRQERGQLLVLGLEPEPECMLETAADAVEFFEQYLYAPSAVARFAELSGLAIGEAEAALRTHLGVCLDACHAAVEFEEPKQSLQALKAAGIPLAKLQITTGLSLQQAGAAQLHELRRYADEVYLHQVVVNEAGELKRYLDLPQALEREPNEQESWRVHFHVPVFQEQLGLFQNTQKHLLQLLSAYCDDPTTAHLEVETYTFDVLPPELRADGVVSAICRELEWTRAQLR